MKEHAWVNELPAAVTVCDASGVILEMNERSRTTFAADGGAALIGTNLLDCHPGASRAKVETLLATRLPNCYTIEKRGARKFIFQAPWFDGGVFKGFVEIAIPTPDEVPHFVRE